MICIMKILVVVLLITPKTILTKESPTTEETLDRNRTFVIKIWIHKDLYI